MSLTTVYVGQYVLYEEEEEEIVKICKFCDLSIKKEQFNYGKKYNIKLRGVPNHYRTSFAW